MDDLTIRQIINFVREGRLRVPTFQRGFIWDAPQVAYLMDSIYKGYPMGSLLIWRTKEKLKFERKLGPYTLPSPDDGLPVDYILDGQQRITSVFGIFQTDIQSDPDDDDSWTHIYFDLLADRDAQDSQMFAFAPGDTSLDPKRHFPLKVLFDTVAYRRATRDLSDDLAEKVDKIQTVFKEARIPAQLVDTDDKTTVAIVFERINRRGVPLDTLQLLTAWTWSEDFHLQQKFEELNDELTPFGFKDVGEENNLLLRCCAAVLAKNASTETLIKLNGTSVREQFDKVVNGVKGAIDFLQTNLQVYSLPNLPYSSMLIPLSVFFQQFPASFFQRHDFKRYFLNMYRHWYGKNSYKSRDRELLVFFAIPGNQQFQYDDEQRNTIIRWFWRVCFAKRYNSQPIKSIQTDMEEMIRLRENRKSELGVFTCNVTSDFFKKEVFRINNVSAKTFVLLVAQNNPRSFISGSPIILKDVLKEYNRNEFHHLYPKAHLKKDGKTIYNPDCLANLTFMSRVDNNQLGGLAPSEYRASV